MTNPETRPEYQAAIIQLETDGRLSPERTIERDRYRHRIMCYIARTLLPTPVERPVDIGMDDEVIS